MWKTLIRSFLIAFLWCQPSFALGPCIELFASKRISSGASLPFIPHRGPGQFDNAIAMNVTYEPIQALRQSIEKITGEKLNFYEEWDPNGEAHVTVITPPEFFNVLSKYLSMDEIERIARDEKIQSSDLKVLGIGSGKATLDGQVEETFFVIVDSFGLRTIRYRIYLAFVKNGGEPSAWDPTWWFPHITIGYTKRDLHEADGVMKNIKGSLDPRFKLTVR